MPQTRLYNFIPGVFFKILGKGSLLRTRNSKERGGLLAHIEVDHMPTMDHDDHPKKSDKIEAITDQISKVVHDSLSTILQRTLGGASPSSHSATTTASIGSSADSSLSISEGIPTTTNSI